MELLLIVGLGCLALVVTLKLLVTLVLLPFQLAWGLLKLVAVVVIGALLLALAIPLLALAIPLLAVGAVLAIGIGIVLLPLCLVGC